MFNSVKKAIVRYFAPKKPRRVVITPATPAVEATGAARADVALAKKLQSVTDAYELWQDVDDDTIRDALVACNPEWGDYWRGDTAALCAALEWNDVAGTIADGNFGLAIAQIAGAVALIKDDKFIFYEGVGYYDELGYELCQKECIESWLINYIDLDTLGKDYAKDTGGKFTRFGFFAPVITD